MQHITDDSPLERRYPNLLEYVRSITNKRGRALLLERLSGEALEGLGQKHNVTAERIRQITSKQLKKRPCLMEDRYIEVFQKYCFEKQDFMVAFDEPELTYNYLDIEYSRGSAQIEALPEDTDFPLSFRKAAEKIVFKNYITIDGERVKITKTDISYYILKTFFKNEAFFKDFVSTYTKFLQEHNLASNEKLLFDERTYQNKFSNSDYVLWKQNKRLRYYDITEYHFEELLKTLAFEQYSDIEYSALKFFRDYPKLMRTYDIRDEYELHNLLKKLYKGAKDSNINFKRMPTIEFGTADRGKQVLELLQKHAPISLNALAYAYDREYGVRYYTVKADYLKNFDNYFYNGIYNKDVNPVPAGESRKLNAGPTDAFKSIADIKRIYSGGALASDAGNIKPLTLKMYGLIFCYCYEIRKDLTAADYYRKLLTDHDIVNLRKFPEAMLQAIPFTTEFAELKGQYEIVELSPSKCINIRKLEAFKITKDDLRDYCNAVYSITEPGSYFTIHSLQKNGFSHLLDKLGFKEWFYSSILSQDSNRFSYGRMGKTRVFVKGKGDVLLKGFIESLISERQSIDIPDLISLIKEDYGVIIGKETVIGIVNNSAMLAEHPPGEKPGPLSILNFVL